MTHCASDVAQRVRVWESFVDQDIINRDQTSTNRGFILTYQRIHPEEVLQHFFTMGGSRSTKHKPNTAHFKTISKREEGNCFYFSQQPECKYTTTHRLSSDKQTKFRITSMTSFFREQKRTNKEQHIEKSLFRGEPKWSSIHNNGQQHGEPGEE